MKTILTAALALIVGLFLGSLPLRSELRKTKDELAAAKDDAARAGNSMSLPLVLGLGSLAAARGQGGAPGQRAGVPNFIVPDASPSVGDEGGRGPDRPDGGRRRGFSAEGMVAAKAAADLRAAQFRTAFFDEARLPPDKQAAVEGVIKTMNDELGKAADELAEKLRTGDQKASPRDMADIGVKLLEVYRRGDDQLKASLDPDAKAAKEKTNFDLFNQVDVGAFTKLGETLDKVGVSDVARRPR